MATFNEAFDSCLNTEFVMTFDGYEMMELYPLLFCSGSPHLQVIAREIFDRFFAHVNYLTTVPLDDSDNGQ